MMSRCVAVGRSSRSELSSAGGVSGQDGRDGSVEGGPGSTCRTRSASAPRTGGTPEWPGVPGNSFGFGFRAPSTPKPAPAARRSRPGVVGSGRSGTALRRSSPASGGSSRAARSCRSARDHHARDRARRTATRIVLHGRRRRNMVASREVLNNPSTEPAESPSQPE